MKPQEGAGIVPAPGKSDRLGCLWRWRSYQDGTNRTIDRDGGMKTRGTGGNEEDRRSHRRNEDERGEGSVASARQSRYSLLWCGNILHRYNKRMKYIVVRCVL